jgi:hypothetical protein
MRVKALKYMAGLYIERVPGKIYDIPTGEARRLIAAGFAEPVAKEQKRATKKRKPVKRKK